jgi:hypothetical protein
MPWPIAGPVADHAGAPFRTPQDREREGRSGGRRAILQPAAPGGCIAPYFTGNSRGGSTQPPPDLLQGMALHPKKSNLLALYQR